MSSTQVSTDRARERPWPIPPARDCRGRGVCIYPGCYETCRKFQPCCLRHWKVAPEVLTRAIEDGWRQGSPSSWLLAIEALRCYWLAVGAS